MGYSAQPFAIDIQKVKDAFGSKDQNLLDKVKKAKLYSVYAEQEDEGAYDKCLEDIIFSYVKPSDRKETKKFFGLIKSAPKSGLTESAHVYGYALMAICEVLGVFLANEGDIFYTGNIFDQTKEFLKEKGFKITMERFWEAEKIFDIPDNDDFPVISSYSKEEVRYLYNKLVKLNIDESKTNSDNDNYDEQEELLKFFRDKLKVCIDNDTQWLAFTH
ncbi:MAG: hypothetical protein V4635_04200 [Bacteroidota bacterium]